MRKTLSLVLAIIMVLTALPISASAADYMHASDDIIKAIKRFEGFSAKAYKNNPEQPYFTVGYGHYGSDVTEDMEISEEDATELLKKDLVRFEGSVNGFFKKHGVCYSRQVFDAVLSITYNIGTDWMKQSSCRIRNYLINGIEKYSESEVVNALVGLSDTYANLYRGLIDRRIKEARILLYGDYSGKDSPDYTYLVLDADGGVTSSGKLVAVYPKDQPYGALPTAFKKGFVLSAWQDSDGNTLNATALAAEALDIKAVWTEGTPKTHALIVSGGAGSGLYAEGEMVSLIPGNASAGEFLAWRSGDIRIITANGDYSLRMPGHDVSITGLRDYKCTGKFCPSESFSDIGSGFWAHDSIDFVYANDLFKGYSDKIFKPNSVMSRGMLVAVLYRLNGTPSVEGYENPFTDVEDNSPYHDAILWAYHNRIANGYADGKFSPNTALKREHLAVFLMRYANYMGYETDEIGKLDQFEDKELVSGYAEEALRWAFGKGIIIGVNETVLSPHGRATRAQVAAMVTRFARNVVAGAAVEELI